MCCSALIKQVNKSIEGTADDEDEGVPTEQAIRAGLELLKVQPPPVGFVLIFKIASLHDVSFLQGSKLASANGVYLLFWQVNCGSYFDTWCVEYSYCSASGNASSC